MTIAGEGHSRQAFRDDRPSIDGAQLVARDTTGDIRAMMWVKTYSCREIGETLLEWHDTDPTRTVDIVLSPTASTAVNALPKLVEALRGFDCPRPCNGRPDDFSVGQCVDAGECGCLTHPVEAILQSKDTDNV